MPAASVKVRRYVWLPNHGQFHCHGTQTYGEQPGRTFARNFVYACGEPLHDGDPVACTPDVEFAVPYTHAKCVVA